MLEVTPMSLDQRDITTGEILASYYYKDIKMIQEVSDISDGFVIVSIPHDRLVPHFIRSIFIHFLFFYYFFTMEIIVIRLF